VGIGPNDGVYWPGVSVTSANDILRMFRQKARIRFAKQQALRFVSHHDLMRCLERALRRAALPLRLSEGYHPHARLSFPSALGVGIVGLDEVMEVELDRWVPPDEIRCRLSAQMPPGLSVCAVTAVDPQRKEGVREVAYCVTVPESARTGLPEAAAALMAQEHLVVTRQRPGKPHQSVDLRRFIQDLRLEGSELNMRFRVTPGGTARPDEVLRLLGLADLLHQGAIVTRTRVVLQRDQGESRQ